MGETAAVTFSSAIASLEIGVSVEMEVFSLFFDGEVAVLSRKLIFDRRTCASMAKCRSVTSQCSVKDVDTVSLRRRQIMSRRMRQRWSDSTSFSKLGRDRGVLGCATPLLLLATLPLRLAVDADETEPRGFGGRGGSSSSSTPDVGKDGSGWKWGDLLQGSSMEAGSIL